MIGCDSLRPGGTPPQPDISFAPIEDDDTIYIYLGPLEGDVTSPDISFLFDDAYMVRSQPAGDPDNNGVDDVLVYTYFDVTTQNRALLFAGPLPELPDRITSEDAVMVIYDDDAADYFDTKYINQPGDMDGDGLDDILIASSSANYDAGTVSLFLGTSGIFEITEADVTISGDASAQRVGAAASPAGDVDGDGYEDLLVRTDDRDDERATRRLRGNALSS